MGPPHRPSRRPSDGEVFSGAEEKAISTHAYNGRDNNVNPSARHRHQTGFSSRASHANHAASDVDVRGGSRERSRSPYRASRSRSRSPYRAGKLSSGEKRRHADDHYSAKGGSDPRRFKVHYEERAPRGSAGHRSQRSYADLDGSDVTSAALAYDDRAPGDQHSQREYRRDRSRSPYRRFRDSSGDRDARGHVSSHRDNNARRGVENGADGYGGVSDAHGKADMARNGDKEQMSLNRLAANATGEESSQADMQDSKLSEAEIIEQRRKRREAIKAKHKSQPGLLIQALEQSTPSGPTTPGLDAAGSMSEHHSPPSSIDSPRTPLRDSAPGSPATFSVNDDEELANRHLSHDGLQEDEGPSAADYDPNMDMQEDRPDHKKPDASVQSQSDAASDVQPAPIEKKEFDMFADDDDDDMFAPADTIAKPARGGQVAKTLDSSLLDNWDYPDGHYRVNLGELLDDRYAVQQQIGKGTFATVVRAQDIKTGNLVAVKIACNNETMYKAGQKEMDFLQLLNQQDPDDKRHIIRLLRNFDHKGHLCIVFEALNADLREVLKKFGRNVGLNLKAIRSYALQMFLALGHMKKCQILHADLKPDNILVSEKRNLLKICDLGTAAFADDAEITPYLVSRFYRAPEVILGMPFDYAIDMWSIGCTLFELYTGRILFAGADNNQMLRAIQECRGKFPIRMLKRSSLADRHFDIDGNFFSQERDKVTGKAIVRQMNYNKTVPGKDLRGRLSVNTKGMSPTELKEHMAFVDLMDKCLQLDPARRITPADALRHAFIAHSSGSVTTEKAAPKVVLAMSLPRLK